MKRKYTIITQEIENKILELRSDNNSCTDIVEKLEISIQSVMKVFKKYEIKRKVKITSEIAKEIKELVEKGWWIKKICEKFDLSGSSVKNFLIKNNINPARRALVSDLPEDVSFKIKELVNKGYGRLKISSTLNIKEDIIRKFIKRNNLDTGNKPNIAKITEDKILFIKELLDEEKTYREISSILGNVSFDGVRRFINKHNLKKVQTEDEIKHKKELRRLRKNFAKAVHRGLTSLIKNGKYQSIKDYLPYSIEDLKIHIELQFEDWMTWENWGPYNPKKWKDDDKTTWTWHIDHIIPESSFKITSMEDPKFIECWAKENLRPLSAKQNIFDSDRGYSKLKKKNI